MPTITVYYWRGTQQHTGTATTYAGAMRIARRTQNACHATYYDEQGRELYDNGFGLVVAGGNEYVVVNQHPTRR